MTEEKPPFQVRFSPGFEAQFMELLAKDPEMGQHLEDIIKILQEDPYGLGHPGLIYRTCGQLVEEEDGDWRCVRREEHAGRHSQHPAHEDD